MPPVRPTPQATLGVVMNGNSAVLVTVDPSGLLLDRRTIDLTQGLPTHPHHHQGSWAVGRYLDSPWAQPTTLDQALALVEQVRQAAQEGAQDGLASLVEGLGLPIGAIALRTCPPLPPTVAETIADNRAQSFADTVMYRQALAGAARERGWRVHWYDRDRVGADAQSALAPVDLQVRLRDMGKRVGAPWRAKHKLAAMAALSVQGVGPEG